jgi:hypothetical protein
MKDNRGRPSNTPPVKKRKYVLEYEDVRYHFDLDKFPNGTYLVENLDPTYDKLEKLYNKWQKLIEPEYHENGRKKRITKDRIKKIKTSETSYWREHYKCFPEDKPKVKKKRRKRNS